MSFLTFTTRGALGIITLNRPQALNALNLAMVCAMQQQLRIWQGTPDIQAVLIHSTSQRAFCAGGDVREVYHAKQQGDYPPENFFREEYALNHMIKTYSKPYIALLNGISMGGGLGISIHGHWRIAAPDLILAMPETGIGFFPDIGSSWFLSYAPGAIGTFLGLTGTTITADDAHYAGFIDSILPATAFVPLIDALAQAPVLSPAVIKNCLAQWQIPPNPLSSLARQRSWIDRCFTASTVEDIIARLTACATPETTALVKTLHEKSPTSLKVTLRQLGWGKTLSFAQCMAMEYHLACRFMQEADFFEGVRAALIDKDRHPRWQPASLAEVSENRISSYFARNQKH